jgi:hypothetical protein
MRMHVMIHQYMAQNDKVAIATATISLVSCMNEKVIDQSPKLSHNQYASLISTAQTQQLPNVCE